MPVSTSNRSLENEPVGRVGHDEQVGHDQMEHGGPAKPTDRGHRDQGSHHAHMAADFRKRFWISLVLTLPILALSPMLQSLVGLREVVRFPGDVYVLFGLSSAVFVYGGRPFLKGSLEELKARRPGMKLLILDIPRSLMNREYEK